MDAKFDRRFQSFCNSLDALAEAMERDLTDSFVLSGISAKLYITFDYREGNEGHIDTVLCNNRIRYRFSKGCSA